MRQVFCIGVAGLALGLAAWAVPSPVADAAAKGDAAALKTLIQQKADVNGTQPDGATALQWAAYKNDLTMADVLLAAGADPKIANRDGATPLSLAAINGSAPMIQKLLKAGAAPNEKHPKGETALMFASRNGNVDAIKVLLDAKADVNAKESVRGTTALMWAAERGHPAAIKLLISKGADVAAEDATDTKGNRAYLAPTVQARLSSAQGAGGLGTPVALCETAAVDLQRQARHLVLLARREPRGLLETVMPVKKMLWLPLMPLLLNLLSDGRAIKTGVE